MPWVGALSCLVDFHMRPTGTARPSSGMGWAAAQPWDGQPAAACPGRAIARSAVAVVRGAQLHPLPNSYLFWSAHKPHMPSSNGISPIDLWYQRERRAPIDLRDRPG
jgi:hypothetical protein